MRTASRGGRGGVASSQRHRQSAHLPDLPPSPSSPRRGSDEPSYSGVGETSEPVPAGAGVGQTDDGSAGAGTDTAGRQVKSDGHGAAPARRKPGSARLAFQYPDVFGRRRTRGGATAAAGRRRASITSGRINFRRRTAQAQRDDVTVMCDGIDKRSQVSRHFLSDYVFYASF